MQGSQFVALLSVASMVVFSTPSAFARASASESANPAEKALAFSAGFIRPPFLPDGQVIRTADNRQVVGKGDLIYLRLQATEEVAPDSLYTLYRRIHKVFHPVTRQYLGDLYTIVGVARVISFSEDIATAQIEQAYSSVTPGDSVMRFEPPPPDEPAFADLPAAPDMPGRIVDIQVQRTLIGQNNLVYLDQGRDDGLRIGDRLHIWRARPGFPLRRIGELRIIALEDRTATALVTRSTTPILIGDRVTYKDETPRAPGEPPQ